MKRLLIIGCLVFMIIVVFVFRSIDTKPNVDSEKTKQNLTLESFVMDEKLA